MRINFILLLTMVLPIFSKSQEINTKYFNKIQEVGKIIATNSTIDIKQANQVLITVDLTNKPKILLTEYLQQKTPEGKYITGFVFKDTSALITQFNLLFKFDKPIIG